MPSKAKRKTASASERPRPLRIGGVEIRPGTREDTEIRVARLPTGTWVSLPLAVVHGATTGPSLWICAAIHGDELNGIEIVRRVLGRLSPQDLRGTLIAAPIVNVFGFLARDRYLPDRRDLNRCFPGSPRGSLAARLANLFLEEVVSRCQYGIDLHTGSLHRTNLPQIRADLEDRTTLRLASAFGAPVIIAASARDGSLREAATARGSHVLVYEAGETLRLSRRAIRVGVEGVLRVMAKLKMVPPPQEVETPGRVVRAQQTKWIRATRSGLVFTEVELGEAVKERQVVASIADVFNDRGRRLRSPCGGVVIGLTTNPVVNRGDAVVHVAET